MVSLCTLEEDADINVAGLQEGKPQSHAQTKAFIDFYTILI